MSPACPVYVFGYYQSNLAGFQKGPWRLAGCLSFLPVHCAFAQAQKYTFW